MTGHLILSNGDVIVVKSLDILSQSGNMWATFIVVQTLIWLVVVKVFIHDLIGG